MLRTARLGTLALLAPFVYACQTPAPSATPTPSPSSIDRDLLDVTVADLHRHYDARTYTVTQVVQWRD